MTVQEVATSSSLSNDPEWYRSAVFYEVLVRSFADSTGDGMGDFAGLISRLDYLKWLGVDALWIPPFYPSPMRDGGYDISNFRDVASQYGTLADFRTLLAAAHARGLRIVVDMVMNHTSDQHPWFVSSRSDPHGPFGDFYVWSDDPTRYSDARVIFVDSEVSNWTFDSVRRQYYWHRFFSHQPDLNYDNPRVAEQMLDTVRFWARLGVDGFRLDAVPYLYEREGTNCENLPETHAFLRRLRRMIDEEFPRVVLLAEANQPPEEVVDYFGTDDEPECHMCFHFPLMPRIFRSLKEHHASGLVDTLESTPRIPGHAQWSTFLRNHDELTLEMVTTDERAAMYGWYAPEPRMRANIGIRRRLASLLDNSPELLRLATAMLLSLPGSPCLYYGDEIAMGDNIWLHDRDAVRTPMQWNGDRNAGFSHADPDRLNLPLVRSNANNYRTNNVELYLAQPGSLLHWLRFILATRRANPAIAAGTSTILETDNDSILALLRVAPTQRAICVLNVSETAQAVRIEAPTEASTRLRDVFGGSAFPAVQADGELELTLQGHGFYWLDEVRPQRD